MEEEIHIEDGSNDRAYFTLVPNIVLNHSSAIDQALYLQMKRFAGEKSGGGLCTASEKTLVAKLKIGRYAFKKALAYLIEHNWIQFSGERTVWTDGGPQKIKTYRVNDIWKLNTEHYKGVSELAPLIKGVARLDKGVSSLAKGVSRLAPTKNYRTDRVTANADFSIVPEEGETTRAKKPPVSATTLQKYNDLIKWAEARREFPFLKGSILKQYKAFKEAKENGLSISRLKERWEEFEVSPFWSDKGFDWMNVVHDFNKKQ